MESGSDLDPIDVLSDLVRIDSVNSDLVPGARGEQEVAEYCQAWLNAQGLEVHRLEKRSGRPSIVGIARGTGGGKTLMFNGHYDTVTLSGYDGDPLDPRRTERRLYGRGSYDMKSGLAAAMVATARVADARLRGDVMVCCVADEEHSSWGTMEVLEKFSADAGVVTEPTDEIVKIDHKGFVWFEVTIVGRSAHGSLPSEGIDAISNAGHFLVELDSWGKRLASGPEHKFLGTGTVHASIIRGGEEASSYPAECRITIERRTVPGETGYSVEEDLRGILQQIEATVPDFAWRLERLLERQPFSADPDHPIVTTLLDQGQAIRGQRPAIGGMSGWTDCALLKDAGIECVLFGPCGGGMHSSNEWVEIESVRYVTEVLVATATEFSR